MANPIVLYFSISLNSSSFNRLLKFSPYLYSEEIFYVI